MHDFTEEEYQAAINIVKKDCPVCGGKGYTEESQTHPYGDTVAWETLHIECEVCAIEAIALLESPANTILLGYKGND